METIKALIIDDEQRAVQSLANLIQEFLPQVELLGFATSVPEGVLKINEWQPELVFLDIEMPQYNGFELLKFFKTIDFEIIFVTAYSNYAIQAFEVSAVDYLLKPVELNQLRKSVEKFMERKRRFGQGERYQVLKENVAQLEVQRVALPMGDGLRFESVHDMVLLEAEGAYTYVNLRSGERILISKRIKFFEELLSNRSIFFRPHRSFLVNLNYLQKYHRGESCILMENQVLVPVSRDQKSGFEQLLRQLHMMHRG